MIKLPPMKNTATNTFWKLPYGLRRTLVRTAFPRKYSALRSLRTLEPRDPDTPSLKPFIEHKCVFIHVPKAAGISVGTGLFGHVTGFHRSIAGYQTILSQREFETFFKFTFVRNPWDRLVSAYFFLKQGGIGHADRRWAAQHLTPYQSFDAFVRVWVDRENVRSWVHFRPQHLYLCLPGERAPAVDFIGFYENLADDYETIRSRLAIGLPLKQSNVTHSKGRDYRAYYTKETKDIVADAYREDIELFGYDFENTSLERQLASRRLS